MCFQFAALTLYCSDAVRRVTGMVNNRQGRNVEIIGAGVSK